MSPAVTAGTICNLHVFAREGSVLLGRTQGVQGSRIFFAGDLYASLAKADGFAAEVLKTIDEYIARNGIDAPVEAPPILRNGYAAQLLTELDLQAAGVGSIIWATGLAYDLGPLKLPLLERSGLPQQSAASRLPGCLLCGHAVDAEPGHGFDDRLRQAGGARRRAHRGAPA